MTAAETSPFSPAAAPAATLGAAPFRIEDLYQLSSRLHLRPTPQGLLVEGPLGGLGLLLANSSRLRLVLAFLAPVRPAELLASLDADRRPAVLRFFEHCHRLGLLTRRIAGQAEEAQGPLAHWEPHDLFFHLRSRRGRHGAPVGATFHLAGVVPPEAASKPAAGPRIPLPRSRRHPDPDPTLTQALEARRSRYGTEPLGLDQLGEFLYRTCRVTGESRVDGERFLQKLYPSGGSLHSLEVYVVPARCGGLERGVYRYLGLEHALSKAGDPGPELELLLEEARQGTGGSLSEIPSVLLVVTARFRRVMRKYQSLAYSLILKEVGALLQTMYLVATAMDLAPCAIGTGDSDRFARAAGLDYYCETSVGELILGGTAR
jgi:SagB-type dehydrogenase family enzyme